MNERISEYFASVFPRTAEFPQADYESRKAVFDTAAAANGYRLAGFRLGLAIFTTKEPLTPDA